MLGANRTSAAEQRALIDFSYDAAYWVNPWGGGANVVWMVQVCDSPCRPSVVCVLVRLTPPFPPSPF